MPAAIWSSYARAVRSFFRAPVSWGAFILGSLLSASGTGVADFGQRMMDRAIERLQEMGATR